jgi:hypothetical protein
MEFYNSFVTLNLSVLHDSGRNFFPQKFDQDKQYHKVSRKGQIEIGTHAEVLILLTNVV